jgi:putative lipoprotein
MKKFSKFALTALACLAFSGCAALQSQKSSDKFTVTILTPPLKINDVGFLHKNANQLNLQIYSSGVNTVNLKINDKICMNGACFEKKEFNKKFFLEERYDDFFAEILERKPLYDGANVMTNSCGFIQDISKYSIKYEVCGKNISFFDAKNRIKIIIKELQ